MDGEIKEFTKDEMLQIVLDEFQMKIRFGICRALTYEVIAQYNDSYELYYNTSHEIDSFITELKDMVTDFEGKNTSNLIKFYSDLEEVQKNLQLRASGVVELRDKYSELQSKIMLQDLGMIPKNFFSFPIRDLKTTKEINKERLLKKKGNVSSSKNQNFLIESVSTDDDELNKKFVFKNPEVVDMFQHDFDLPQSLHSNGKVTELFSISVPRTFQIVQGNVYPLEDDCNLLIIMYEELNTTSQELKCYPKHYLVVGSSFYPLIQNTTFVYKTDNLYIFPDFYEDSESSFISLLISNESNTSDLDDVLNKINVLHSLNPKKDLSDTLFLEETFSQSNIKSKRKGLCKKLISICKKIIKAVTMEFPISDKPNFQANNALKIKCLGEVTSGLGLLLPKYNLKIENNTFIIGSLASELNKTRVMEDAWQKVFAGVSDKTRRDERKLEDRVVDASDCCVEWLREDADEDFNEESFLSRMIGLSDTIVKCALIAHYICQSIKVPQPSGSAKK